MNRTSLRVAAVTAATIISLAATGFAVARAAASPSAAVPPGYQWVVDDTGTIGVAIPADWTVTSTASDDFGKTATPSINALGPGDASLTVWAESWTGTPQPWDPSSCDPMAGECSAVISTAAYDDGSFAGYRQTIEECCGGGPYDIVAAAAHDGSLTVTLILDYGEARDPAEVLIFDTMLATFARVGAPLPQIGQAGEPVFPYGDFYSVPRLGSEPVRGTGCGAAGQIGDVIPDGIWAGFASVEGSTVIVDLLCVFTPEAATGVIAEGTATIIYGDPNYLIVNNNERERSVPAAPTLQLRDATWNERGECVESDYIAGLDHRDFQAWVTIQGGQATSIVWGCDRILYDRPVPGGPQGAVLAPPFPVEGGGGSFGFWPYGEFWNVPQLGAEPVRGSGCGANGQLGDTIPDGLWAGYISYDAAADVFWVDVLCIFAGDVAAAIRAEGTANIVNDEPDYLIVNNSEQRRQVANNLQAIGYSIYTAEDRRCVEGSVTVAEPGGRLAPTAAEMFQTQAWIRIHQGAVTWIKWGCIPGVTEPGG